MEGNTLGAEAMAMRVGRTQTTPGALWGLQDSQGKKKKKDICAVGSSQPLSCQSLWPDCQLKSSLTFSSLAAYLCPWACDNTALLPAALGK